jgi:hypothetical protein
MMRIALGRRADGESVTSIAKGLTYKTASGQERTVSRRALYNGSRPTTLNGPRPRRPYKDMAPTSTLVPSRSAHGPFLPYPAQDSYSYGEPQSSAMHLCARALLPIFAKAG